MNAYFWFDNWSDFGPLIDYLWSTGPAQMGINISAKVQDATTNEGWILRQPRSQNYLLLLAHIITLNNPRHNDSYYMDVDATIRKGFVTSLLWEKHRPREPLKTWASTIWFKFNSPNTAFTMWVSTLDRLPTKLRLISWGLQIQPGCIFFSDYDECMDHLLLRCSYSSQYGDKFIEG